MTGHSNRVWILGAPDPEMVAIERLLRECGERVEYATDIVVDRYRVRRVAYPAFDPPCGCSHTEPVTVWEGDDLSAYTEGLGAYDEGCHHPSRWVEYHLVNGEWTRAIPRVSSRTAYSAHISPEVDSIRASGGSIYFVECAPSDVRYGVPDAAYTDCAAMVCRIDHHRPGDPGFGHGPDHFLAASSLGQVITELGRLGLLWFEQSEAPTEHPDFLRCWRPVDHVDHPDYAPLIELFGRWTVRSASGRLLEVPHDLVVAAACDHCLGHAWAGRCPGVTRDDVRGYRARTASTRPVEPVEGAEYERRFAAAADIIRQASTFPLLTCGCGTCGNASDRGLCDCGYCGGQFQNVVDLRGQHVPELPDVACYLGVAYLASVTERDRRTKTVIGGATTERCVNAFMRVWGPAQKLTGIYGDPARGFAGGYEVAS